MIVMGLIDKLWASIMFIQGLSALLQKLNSLLRSQPGKKMVKKMFGSWANEIKY